MKQKITNPKTLLLICCALLIYSIVSEPNDSDRDYKIIEAFRGIICIGLSIAFWYTSQFFEKRRSLLDSILEWCCGMLAIFVFFPFSAMFFQNVSSLVTMIILGSIVYIVFLASGGKSWDGRDPGEGGD